MLDTVFDEETEAVFRLILLTWILLYRVQKLMLKPELIHFHGTRLRKIQNRDGYWELNKAHQIHQNKLKTYLTIPNSSSWRRET